MCHNLKVFLLKGPCCVWEPLKNRALVQSTVTLSQHRPCYSTRSPLLVTHHACTLPTFIPLSCLLPFAERAAVEMRERFNKQGGCARSGPARWSEAGCTRAHVLLSTQLHMAPHQEELNQRCCSPHVRTAARLQLSWIYSTTRCNNAVWSNKTHFEKVTLEWSKSLRSGCSIWFNVSAPSSVVRGSSGILQSLLKRVSYKKGMGSSFMPPSSSNNRLSSSQSMCAYWHERLTLGANTETELIE